MGIIDRIKSGLGMGPGQQPGSVRKKEKSAEIDTRDRVNISGKKSDQDQGNLINPGKIPSGKEDAPVDQAESTIQQADSTLMPKIPKKKVDEGPNNPVNITMMEDLDQTVSSQAVMENKLKGTLHRMTAIARSVGGDFKMDVEEGMGWAYNFETNSITYPKQDLIDKHPDYALGVILHESAHRRYSRWFVEPDFEENEPFLFLNNAVEDPRVNNIQISRFAGAKDFFKKIYDEDLFKPEFGSSMTEQMVEGMVKEGVDREDAEKAVKKMGVKIPRHTQYGLGLIYDWYTDGKADPRIKDKKVKKALKETAPIFREVFKLKRDIMAKDLTPAESDKQAMESYLAVRDKLWPVFQKLVEEDKKSLAKGLSGAGGSGKSGKPGSKSGKQGKPGKQGKQGQSGGSSGSQQSQQQQQSGGSGSSSGSAGGSQQQQQQQQQSGGADESQQQDQKTGDKQNAGGAGGAGGAEEKQVEEKKDAQGAGGAGKQEKDKDKKPEQGEGAGAGAGEGKMDPEKAREIAEKVIENLNKQINSQKFEEKDKNARRNNRQGGNQSSQASKQGQQGQQGNQAGQQGDKSGQQDNKAGDQNKQGGDQSQPSGDGQKSQGQGNNSQGGSQGGQTSDIDLPSLEDLLQRKMEIEARNEAMQSPYDRYVYDTCEFSDEFSGELKNFIHEHERPKYVGNFHTGKKLNLRRAMQSEAKYQLTGEFDDEIWLRREDPQKRDHQFIFVLDESGSMRGGEKWENALKGLVLCQEALDELEIDFGVIGFSDNPQIHKNLEDKFDENFRDNELNQIMGSPSGGTNDADAVKIALNMLKHQDPEIQKTIVVITDGEGKTEEMKKLIEEAEQAGIKIVGVGIGEGTSAVEAVYKDKVKVDRIAQLPTQLSDIVREQVEDSYDSM